MKRLSCFVGAAVWIFAGHASAVECNCDSVDGSVETIFEIESADGREMKLRFEADPISLATNQAYLCAGSDATVTLAKMWMPAHGHGSTPTRLVPVGDSCTRIERIRFPRGMDGEWEIQVTLSDNDSGTFTFDVTD